MKTNQNNKTQLVKVTLWSRVLELKNKLEPSNKTSSSIKFKALKSTFRTKRFMVIVISTELAVIFAGNGVLSTIYLSIVAAGIFYSIFNLYPEQLVKHRVARQCTEMLLKIRSNKKWLLQEVMKEPLFKMFDSSDLSTREDCEKIVKKINEFIGARLVELSEGLNIYKAYRDISQVTLDSYNGAVSNFYRRNKIKGEKKLGLVLEELTNLDLEAVNKLIQVNGIQEFHVFYEALLHYQRVLEKRKQNMFFEGLESNFICYSLFQAPDKVLFHAALELGVYDDYKLIANNAMDRKVKGWCADLTENMIPNNLFTTNATESEIKQAKKFMQININS